MYIHMHGDSHVICMTIKNLLVSICIYNIAVYMNINCNILLVGICVCRVIFIS